MSNKTKEKTSTRKKATLEQDSKVSDASLTDIIEEVESVTTTLLPQRILLQDEFVRRFPSIWALKYKNIKGKPTTFASSKDPFKHRPWQTKILDDRHPNKVVEKSRQLGLSEVGMTEVLHFLIMNNSTKAVYVFPRNQQLIDFSKSRISPVLKSSEYFKSTVDISVSSMSTKKILDSYLFMRSGWSGALGEGIDVDIVALDEYDRMKEGVELAFQEGLKSSSFGLMRRWSTPTIPGRGINALFLKSDQMRYIWTCESCGHRQFLSFEENIIQINPNGVNLSSNEVRDGTFIVGCKKCKKPLNRMGIGEWTPLYPGIKETRGYHISQLDAAWISADDVMRRKLSYSSRQLFYNYVVGEPHASEGLLITDEDLRAAVRLPKRVMSRTQTYVGVSVGIDWGETSYMVILGIKGNGEVDLLNMYRATDSPREPLRAPGYFASILRAYSPNVIVADFGYGADKNSYMYTQFPKAFYSCYWTTAKDHMSKTRFIDSYNENSRQINVDKTVRMQRTIHSLKGRLIGLFPWDEDMEMFSSHVRNTRIMDDEDSGVIFQRATRVGPDHYMCALAYGTIGVDKLTSYNLKFNTSMSFEML